MTRPNESDPDKAPGLDAERARRARALLRQDDLDRAFPISKEITILLCYAIMMSVGFLIR
ncbi:MAG: hypothetical protein DI629_20220 [Mesorhizobium amorphae]|nr:MAG: hypothetical protein DI629_20220 [Mesorhizobium amorphae]